MYFLEKIQAVSNGTDTRQDGVICPPDPDDLQSTQKVLTLYSIDTHFDTSTTDSF